MTRLSMIKMRIIGPLAIVCGAFWILAGSYNMHQARAWDIDYYLEIQKAKQQAFADRAGHSIEWIDQRASLEKSNTRTVQQYKLLVICGAAAIIAGIGMLFRIPAASFLWLALVSGVLLCYLLVWFEYVRLAGAARLPPIFVRGLVLLGIPCVLSWWQFLAAKRMRKAASEAAGN